MTSTTASSNTPTGPPPTSPYTFTRPSETSTRALVSSSNNPNPEIVPEPHRTPLHPPHRNHSHNYEAALSSRAASSTTTSTGESSPAAPPQTIGSLAYRGDGAQAVESRPGVGLLGRQQSWNQDEVKRARMQSLLDDKGAKKEGYTSTSGAGVTAKGL